MLRNKKQPQHETHGAALSEESHTFQTTVAESSHIEASVTRGQTTVNDKPELTYFRVAPIARPNNEDFVPDVAKRHTEAVSADTQQSRDTKPNRHDCMIPKSLPPAKPKRFKSLTNRKQPTIITPSRISPASSELSNSEDQTYHEHSPLSKLSTLSLPKKIQTNPEFFTENSNPEKNATEIPPVSSPGSNPPPSSDSLNLVAREPPSISKPAAQDDVLSDIVEEVLASTQHHPPPSPTGSQNRFLSSSARSALQRQKSDFVQTPETLPSSPSLSGAFEYNNNTTSAATREVHVLDGLLYVWATRWLCG